MKKMYVLFFMCLSVLCGFGHEGDTIAVFVSHNCYEYGEELIVALDDETGRERGNLINELVVGNTYRVSVMYVYDEAEPDMMEYSYNAIFTSDLHLEQEELELISNINHGTLENDEYEGLYNIEENIPYDEEDFMGGDYEGNELEAMRGMMGMYYRTEDCNIRYIKISVHRIAGSDE